MSDFLYVQYILTVGILNFYESLPYVLCARAANASAIAARLNEER